MATSSENFNFVFEEQNQAQLIHPEPPFDRSVYSDPLKADGYYGRTDGVHTVQIRLTDFIGDVHIQGSVVLEPTSEDWFNIELYDPNWRNNQLINVDTTGLGVPIYPSFTNETTFPNVEPTTQNKALNLLGNWIWVRVAIENWKQGAVNNVLLNH